MSIAIASRTYRGPIEVAGAVALYAVYEIVRGFGSEDFAAARCTRDDIVALERSLGVYWEHGVQTASLGVPGLGSALGFLYLALHLVGTGAFLIWVHRLATAGVRVRAHVDRARDGDRARRLRALSRGAAAARRPRLLRCRQLAHEAQPQLRPARRALQPDRRRAQPPLRLRADRRRRDGVARQAPLGQDRRRRCTRWRCSTSSSQPAITSSSTLSPAAQW